MSALDRKQTLEIYQKINMLMIAGASALGRKQIFSIYSFRSKPDIEIF